MELSRRLDEIVKQSDAVNKAWTGGQWIAPEEQDGTEDGWENSSSPTGQVLNWLPDYDPECDDEVIAEGLDSATAVFIANSRTHVPELAKGLQRVIAWAAEKDALEDSPRVLPDILRAIDGK